MRFFVVIDTENPNIIEDIDPSVALACYLDALLDHSTEPVAVYLSLADLQKDAAESIGAFESGLFSPQEGDE